MTALAGASTDLFDFSITCTCGKPIKVTMRGNQFDAEAEEDLRCRLWQHTSTKSGHAELTWDQIQTLEIKQRKSSTTQSFPMTDSSSSQVPVESSPADIITHLQGIVHQTANLTAACQNVLRSLPKPPVTVVLREGPRRSPSRPTSRSRSPCP